MATSPASLAKGILHSSDKHHLMLLYDNEAERTSTEVNCIVQALSKGQYCIFATINAANQEFLQDLQDKIPKYQNEVQNGNSKIVDFTPYYATASKGDLTPFIQLKQTIEEELQARSTAHAA